MTSVRDELPGEVHTVLTAAAEVAIERAGGSGDPDRLLATNDGVDTVLSLLTGSAGLRHLLRQRLPNLSTHPASELISVDEEAVAQASAAVRHIIAEARRAQRRRHRAQRRAGRPDAEQRRVTRLEDRIADLRAGRDRLEGQLSALRDENRDLRATIDNLDAELSQVRRHLDVTHARLERVQSERDEARAAAAPHTPTRSSAVVTRELGLTVEVLGGGTEIGGSCVLIGAGNTRILVDAGSRPHGMDAESLAPPGIGRLEKNPPDAIVVTHAHNDHAGWVPALVTAHPGAPVIASAPTCDLLGTMWTDSAKIMARRADREDSWDDGPLPPYQQSDVDAAIQALSDLSIGQRRRVGDVEIELFNAGHIVGAVGVVVTAGPERVVVSGDISMPGQLSVGGLELPDSAIGADVLLLESTYVGAGRLPPRSAMVDEFVTDVDRILGRDGRILVPAFALGRAQEVALILKNHLPEAEVLIDGLARDLSRAYQRHHGPDGERLRIFDGNVRAVEPGRTHAAIAEERPCVVVSTSGMLAGGPAVTWARALLPHERNALMIVGYQDTDSPGSRLLGLTNGSGSIDLPDSPDPLEVSSFVGHYRLGAHATEDELVKVAATIAPGTLIPVHGKLSAQRRFQQRLELRRQRTVLADEPWRRLDG
ncbi:MAG TPA: MBL fold metallo-hydrolase [Candidatus Stackebrandtia excrementipullorum]|nr:MBL fold metallo-hydrolase [Candidatus Stackebrandtia excrementipullorum]